MKRYLYFITIILLVCAIVPNSYAVYNTPTDALTKLTNISKITAQNAQTSLTTNTNVTTATMYGGYMITNEAVIQSIQNLGRVVWTINFTNTGNATASFVAKVVASNVNPGGGTWSHHFNNTANLNNLSAGAGTTFQFVITNISPAANGSYMSYLIMVSNTTANLSAHAYWDSSSVNFYGANLGIGTNYSETNTLSGSTIGPVVYLQFAGHKPVTNQSGFLTAIVSGPVLEISKSIDGITHPSGLYSGTNWAEPGALITYKIHVSNSGSSYATNVQIIDTIPTSYFVFVAATNGTIFSNSALNGSPTNEIVFTPKGSQNNKLNAGESDTVKITVRLK